MVYWHRFWLETGRHLSIGSLSHCLASLSMKHFDVHNVQTVDEKRAKWSNSTAIPRLRLYVAEIQKDWEIYVQLLTYANNVQVHGSTILTRFSLIVLQYPLFQLHFWPEGVTDWHYNNYISPHTTSETATLCNDNGTGLWQAIEDSATSLQKSITTRRFAVFQRCVHRSVRDQYLPWNDCLCSRELGDCFAYWTDVVQNLLIENHWNFAKYNSHWRGGYIKYCIDRPHDIGSNTNDHPRRNGRCQKRNKDTSPTSAKPKNVMGQTHIEISKYTEKQDRTQCDRCYSRKLLFNWTKYTWMKKKTSKSLSERTLHKSTQPWAEVASTHHGKERLSTQRGIERTSTHRDSTQTRCKDHRNTQSTNTQNNGTHWKRTHRESTWCTPTLTRRICIETDVRMVSTIMNWLKD